MKQRYRGSFADIVSIENLLGAWSEFVRGKQGKRDVQKFSWRLMDNICSLNRELATGGYRHGGYHAFRISDPKPRNIHKARVRDRLVHHALHRVLMPFFDRLFIADSYSCRTGKGVHRALNQFRSYARRVSANHTRTCWVLQCDIRAFFASVDHSILLDRLRERVVDVSITRLLEEVVRSFSSTRRGVGIPLGNITSQLFANVYLHEFDQYMKHQCGARYYIRYADDFVVLSPDRARLEALIPRIREFLAERLRLALHPRKVSIGTIASGIDFLGWVHFPTHRVLRTATRRRMVRRLSVCRDSATIASYRGLLKHGNTWKLGQATGIEHGRNIFD